MNRWSTIHRARGGRHLAVAALASALGLAFPSAGLAQAPAPFHLERHAARLARLREHRVVDLVPPASADEPFELRLSLGERTVTLDLEKHSVRSARFEVQAQLPDGSFASVDPGPVRTFRGEVRDLKASVVVGALLETGLECSIRLPDGTTYVVEPVDPTAPLGELRPYVVYRMQDVASSPARCGVPDGEPLTRESASESSGLLGSACGGTLCVAELACDADVEFYQGNGSNVGWAQSRIESIVNTANVQYEREVSLTHLITTLIVRTAEPDPYTACGTYDRVNQMNIDWLANHASVPRDLAHLFSLKAFTDGFIGWAIGGVCQGAYSVGNYAPDLLNCAADLLGHELGHNWGATHCTCANPPYTMNPSLTCTQRFHPTISIPEITNTRNSVSCVRSTAVNDRRIGAIVVCPGASFGSTSLATNDGVASCGNSNASPDVWYAYTPSTNGTVTIDTCDASFDTVLSMGRALAGAGYAELVCNDDSSCGTRSRVSLGVTAGTMYFIRVAGKNGASGSFTLNVSGPACGRPMNDDCANALVICEGKYEGTTAGATSDGSSTCGVSGPDVWYRYTALTPGIMTLDTCDSYFPNQISVHSDCPGTASNTIACSAFACSTPGKGLLQLAVAADTPYYIRVAGYFGSGPFVLGVTAPDCAYDNCSGAIDTPGGGRFVANLIGSNDDGESSCGSSSSQPDVWFKHLAVGNGTLRVNTCGTHDLTGVDTGVDTVISVHSGCPGTIANDLACNDDWPSGGDASACSATDTGSRRDSAISLPVISGQRVYIRVSRFGSTPAGPFILNVESPPNLPPATPPAPTGPSRGWEGIAASFSARSTDPEGQEIRYRFDWGDGTVAATGFVSSGTLVSRSHTYPSEGLYYVRVLATDRGGQSSPWSSASIIGISDVECRTGNVDVDDGGAPVDVLYVNGTTGAGTVRSVVVDNDVALEVSLLSPPAGPANPIYAVWLWRRGPGVFNGADLPYGLGRMCLSPLMSSCGISCPAYAALTIAGYCDRVRCSTPEATGSPAPGIVLRVPAGRFAAGETLWIQGILRDNSDTSGHRLSVTNGIEATVVE